MQISEQIASCSIQYNKLILQLPEFKQIQSDFALQFDKNYLYSHPITQLHYVGTITFFYSKHEKYFIGTNEGKVFIKDNQNKERTIQITKQEGGLISSIINKVTPFKSSLKIEKKKQKSFFDFPYFRSQHEPEKYENSIVSITLSNDDRLLLIGIQQGEVHIYHYSSLTKLETLDFGLPQQYLLFYSQSSEKGLFNTIEKQIHKTYESLICDVKGNINKLCFDIFKIANNRTLKYDHYILGEQQENDKVYDIKVIETKKLVTRVIVMWNTKIELLHIKLGKTREYEIISKINRHDLTQFYDHFNSMDGDLKIIYNCNRNLINLGTGKVRIYESEHNQYVELSQQWILFHYGPYIILADNYLKPLRFGILAINQKNLKNQGLPINISFVSFISDNIILIQYDNGLGQLINLSDFGIEYSQFQSTVKKINEEKQQFDKFIFCGTLQDSLNNMDNRFRFYSKDDKIYHHNILYIDYQCRVFFCTLYEWQFYLSVLCDKNQHIQGLSECYNILNKQNKVLANLEEDNIVIKINKFIQQFAKGFCENIKIFDNEKVSAQIIYVLEFLLTTNNEDIIFTDLRDLLKFQNKVSILYKYIEEYQIDFIPIKVLLELEQEISQESFYRLICGFDPSKIRLNELIPILMKHQYFELLIYFCINNLDFITPIVTLCEMSISISYIIMMLQGQNLVGNKTLIKNHHTAVSNILNFLFNNEQILLKILNLDYQIGIGLICYHHKVLKAISMLEKEINIKIVCFQQNDSGEFNTDLEKCQNTLEKIYVRITQCYEQLLEQQNPTSNIKYLYFFQSEAILSRMISIKKGTHLKLLKHFLFSYEEHNIQKINLFFLNHFHIFFNNNIVLDDILQIQQLLNQQLQTQTLTQCYLLDLQGKYLKCFQVWLNLKDLSLKKQIFPWLNSILQRKLEIRLPQEQFIDYFQELMLLDSKETYEIINSYYKELQPILINSIQNEKQAIAYIKYMEYIFADHILLNEQTNIRYIKYLCQFQPKAVKKQLLLNSYSLKDVLQICIDSHNYGACQYIYHKLGDCKAAVEVMASKLVLKIKLCTRQILKTKMLNEVDKEKVRKRLDKIKLFIKNNGEEYKEMNNLWLVSLDRFFKDNPLKNLTAKSLPQLLKEQLLNVTSYLLYNMLLSMNFYDFVQIISIKYPEMSASIFSRIIEAIKDLAYSQSQFYYYGQVLYFNEKAVFLEKIKQYVERGIRVDKLNCGCQIVDQFVVTYKCGHAFHISCLPNNQSRCCLCSNQIKDQILKIPIEKIKINQRLQFEQKTKEYHSKMDKLKKFEHSKILQSYQQVSIWDIK